MADPSRLREGSETWDGAAGPSRSGVGNSAPGQAHPLPLPQAGGEKFGASALTLCAIAARALGWRPGEFWAATPAELGACLADPSAPSAAMDRAHLNRLLEADDDG